MQIHSKAQSSFQYDFNGNLTNVTSAISSALPTVTVAPSNQITTFGEVAAASVFVAGPGPFSYQWYMNGLAVQGATSSTLFIPSMGFTNQGNYSVVVCNTSGCVTSSVAAVLLPGGINILTITNSTNPPSISVPNYTYTWGYEFQVTTPITVNGLSAWDGGGGLYGEATVGLWTNAGPLLASATIRTGTFAQEQDGFRWEPITPLTLQPGFYVVGACEAGPTAYFGPSGTNALSTIPGVTYVQDRFVYRDGFAYPMNSDFPSYVGWFGGSVHIDSRAPTIIQQPISDGVFVGGSASFTVEATSGTPIYYQWQKDGTNLSDGAEISGVNMAELAVNPASFSDSGNYSCIITNQYSAVTSSVAILNVETHSQLLNGLVAYYQFESNGLDSSTNHLDLTLFGTPGFAPGLFGHALDLHHNLNQYAQRLTDDAAFNFGSGDFTIQVWMNFYSFGGYEQTFIEKFQGASGPGWTLTSPSGFQFFAGGALTLNGSASVPVNIWHQLVVRRNGNMFDMLFDSVEIASGSTSSSISATTNGLLIGTRDSQDGRDFSVDGRLDEVAIWNRALSNPDVNVLYNGGQGNALLPIPPVVSAVSSNNILTLSWRAVAGQTYQLQYATNLAQPDWMNLGPPIIAGTTNLILSESITNVQVFYRLLLQLQ